jgi:hypothetical protein
MHRMYRSRLGGRGKVKGGELRGGRATGQVGGGGEVEGGELRGGRATGQVGGGGV